MFLRLSSYEKHAGRALEFSDMWNLILSSSWNQTSSIKNCSQKIQTYDEAMRMPSLCRPHYSNSCTNNHYSTTANQYDLQNIFNQCLCILIENFSYTLYIQGALPLDPSRSLCAVHSSSSSSIPFSYSLQGCTQWRSRTVSLSICYSSSS